MRIVIQRVTDASVSIKNQPTQVIGKGLLVLVGIEGSDTLDNIVWLCKKIVRLRIFPDAQDKMNLSIQDINGDILLISQFTLHANTKKGNRPSYTQAAAPSIAIPLYEKLITVLENTLEKPIKTGIFGADMKVSLTNDGPVTIIIDSKEK